MRAITLAKIAVHRPVKSAETAPQAEGAEDILRVALHARRQRAILFPKRVAVPVRSCEGRPRVVSAPVSLSPQYRIALSKIRPDHLRIV
jgi:hypothetical protein